jgi:hypothetical protein
LRVTDLFDCHGQQATVAVLFLRGCAQEHSVLSDAPFTQGREGVPAPRGCRLPTRRLAARGGGEASPLSDPCCDDCMKPPSPSPYAAATARARVSGRVPAQRPHGLADKVARARQHVAAGRAGSTAPACTAPGAGAGGLTSSEPAHCSCPSFPCPSSLWFSRARLWGRKGTSRRKDIYRHASWAEKKRRI